MSHFKGHFEGAKTFCARDNLGVKKVECCCVLLLCVVVCCWVFLCVVVCSCVLLCVRGVRRSHCSCVV
jgi:hypothetical protein